MVSIAGNISSLFSSVFSQERSVAGISSLFSQVQNAVAAGFASLKTVPLIRHAIENPYLVTGIGLMGSAFLARRIFSHHSQLKTTIQDLTTKKEGLDRENQQLKSANTALTETNQRQSEEITLLKEDQQNLVKEIAGLKRELIQQGPGTGQMVPAGAQAQGDVKSMFDKLLNRQPTPLHHSLTASK